MSTMSLDNIFQVNAVDELVITEAVISEQSWPYVIVDNLYKDPQKVREHVLSLNFKPPQSRHPGMFAQLSSDVNLFPLYELIHKIYTHQFGYSCQETIQFSRNISRALFACLNRPENDLNKFQGKPHVDNCMVAGLVYLNPEHMCQGGTGFYKHKPTGVETLIMRHQPSNEHEKKMLALIEKKGGFQHFKSLQEKSNKKLNYHDFIEDIIQTEHVKNYMTESTEIWELTGKVEMKFNRLVLYPAFLLHSAYYKPEWFDLSIDKQRLTQNIFIK